MQYPTHAGRVPKATGAPAPQGPRNEGEIGQASEWQRAMYGSHGALFGLNPGLAAAQSSAGSGGQSTAHGDATNDAAYNSHSGYPVP